MKTQVWLMKGLYQDRVIIALHIGDTVQSWMIGYSELHNFFSDDIVQKITKDNSIQMWRIKLFGSIIGKE